MKLFIWCSPYPVDYEQSMLMVVAEDLESAKRLASGEQARWYAFGQYADEFNDDALLFLTSDGGLALGPPTRVVELPCAEWHRWEE